MSDQFDNSNLYEGLFLMSQSAVGSGVGTAIEHIREVLGRIDAEVITLRRWDDRKLAYPIKGQKRGLFLFSLFRADGTKLAEAERACNLSEQVLRVMVTKCEHYGQAELDAELDAARNSEVEQKPRGERPADDKASEPEEEEAVESAAD